MLRSASGQFSAQGQAGAFSTSPSPVLQFSCSANILGAYCKGRHCVRRNVKMIALTSALKWFTIFKETWTWTVIRDPRALLVNDQSALGALKRKCQALSRKARMETRQSAKERLMITGPEYNSSILPVPKLTPATQVTPIYSVPPNLQSQDSVGRLY